LHPFAGCVDGGHIGETAQTQISLRGKIDVSEAVSGNRSAQRGWPNFQRSCRAGNSVGALQVTGRNSPAESRDPPAIRTVPDGCLMGNTGNRSASKWGARIISGRRGVTGKGAYQASPESRLTRRDGVVHAVLCGVPGPLCHRRASEAFNEPTE